MHQTFPIFPPEIHKFWRISGKFDIVTFAQCCKTTNCHYCWKRIGNVFQVVWSTASFASLIIHTSTCREDNSKLMNEQIAAASGVLVCCLPRFCFLDFFTHSCLNICTDRVTPNLLLKRISAAEQEDTLRMRASAERQIWWWEIENLPNVTVF